MVSSSLAPETVSKEGLSFSAGGGCNIEATCLPLIRKVARFFFTAMREPGATEATSAVALGFYLGAIIHQKFRRVSCMDG